MCDQYYCRKQPGNMGLQCKEEDANRCKTCGWNPEVEKQRKKERIEKLKENEK